MSEDEYNEYLKDLDKAIERARALLTRWKDECPEAIEEFKSYAFIEES